MEKFTLLATNFTLPPGLTGWTNYTSAKMTIMSIVIIMGMLVTMMKMRMMLIKMMMIVITVMIMQMDLIVAERRMTVRVRQVTHRAQRQDTYLVASYAVYGSIKINII